MHNKSMQALLGLVALVFLPLGATNVSAAFINIQPIVLCLDDGTGCANTGPAGNDFFAAETNKIWAQAGIKMNFLNTTFWNSSEHRITDSTNGDDGDLRTDGESLFGSIANTMTINMYIVEDYITNPGFLLFGSGCGHSIFAGACNGTEGVIINDLIFESPRIDTIAHEIGHVLGLTHNGFGAGGGNNLMTSGGSRTTPGTIGDITPDGAGLSVLTQAQIDQVFTDEHNVIKVTIPSTLPLLLLGLIAIFGSLKRRTSVT